MNLDDPSAAIPVSYALCFSLSILSDKNVDNLRLDGEEAVEEVTEGDVDNPAILALLVDDIFLLCLLLPDVGMTPLSECFLVNDSGEEEGGGGGGGADMKLVSDCLRNLRDDDVYEDEADIEDGEWFRLIGFVLPAYPDEESLLDIGD